MTAASRRAGSAPSARLLDWKSVAGLLVSIALLYWVFRGEDPREIWHHITSANPVLFALSAAAATGVFWIRAWRWRAILEPIDPDIPFRARFAAVCIGFMGNNIFPARIGEFMRAYALARTTTVPLVASFSSLLIERLFDGVFVIVFLFLAIALPDFPGVRAGSAAGAVTAARTLGVLVLLLLLCLGALVFWPRRAVALAERMVGVLPERARRPFIDGLEAFLSGASVLRNPRLVLRTALWSGALWLFNAFGFWLAFRAFGIDLPFTAALFLQSVVAIAVSIPSAPGFFGPFEGAAKLVLGMWGADTALATAYAVGFHLAGYIPVTLLGGYYAWQLRLSMVEIEASEDIIETAVERDVERRSQPRPALGDVPAMIEAGAATERVHVSAPAKLNLSLRVLAREPDGYHRLDTIFCALALADDLEVARTGDAIELTVNADPEAPGASAALGPPSANLVYRAARAYLDAVDPRGGVHIHLYKRIPAGAGLGGGSSDAAATLLALEELYGRPLGMSALHRLGAQLGADVPFFLSGVHLARAGGRGDRLTPLRALPRAAVLLAVPLERVSTPAAYAELDRVRGWTPASALDSAPVARAPAGGTPGAAGAGTAAAMHEEDDVRRWEDVGAMAVNDFEPVVFALRPQLRALREALATAGARPARLTGTGAAVYGVFAHTAEAERARAALRAHHADVHWILTHTRD